MMDGPQEVAADTKEILDGAVHAREPVSARIALPAESTPLKKPAMKAVQ